MREEMDAAEKLPDNALQAVKRIDMVALCGSSRCAEIDRLDNYAAGRQYDHLRFDWNGNYQNYADAADIAPGWYVPLKHRKPAVRLEVPRLIVSRFSAMLLGEDRFPQISVEGDDEAEDYVNALAEESQLKIRLQEARDKGGASGTAVISFAFIDGKPRLQVHRSKHIHVLKWADRYDLRPGTVLKCYRYERSVFEAGKPKKKPFYYVRLWTETAEIVWEPVPEDMAKSGAWVSGVQSYAVQHDYGECPVYWIQNLPDSDREDGVADFAGLLDNFDEMNRLLSATSKGTIANVDPTLVVKEDPSANNGSLKKGSENAIFAKGGAEYLELSGTSINTARELLRALLQYSLDVAGVVLGDADKISGAAKSAAAMRLLYQPMINQCDKLRAQYGQQGIVPLLKGMLKAAKRIGSQEPGPIITTSDGRRVQQKPIVDLEPRVDTEYVEETDPETGEPTGEKTRKVRTVERSPGSSERITLKWPPYFKPTQQDASAAVQASVAARGVLVSPKTATKAVQNLFGIGDVEQELIDIEAQKQIDAARFPGPELGLPEIPEEDQHNSGEPEGE